MQLIKVKYRKHNNLLYKAKMKLWTHKFSMSKWIHSYLLWKNHQNILMQVIQLRFKFFTNKINYFILCMSIKRKKRNKGLFHYKFHLMNISLNLQFKLKAIMRSPCKNKLPRNQKSIAKHSTKHQQSREKFLTPLILLHSMQVIYKMYRLYPKSIKKWVGNPKQKMKQISTLMPRIPIDLV